MSAISSEAAPPARFTADDVVKAMLAPRVKLDVWSHGVRISGFGNDVRTMMLDMCRQVWGEYSMVRVGRFRTEKKITRVYAGSNKQRSYFHFHRNSLPKVMAGLERLGIPSHRIEITEHELYEPVKVNHPLHDERPPREKQLPIIEYLIAPPDPRYAPSKVVTLQTGGGKTYLSLYALRAIGVRTAIILKGMYIDKWIGDIEEAYGAEKGALMVIRGIPQLRAAIEMARQGAFKPRVVVFSNKTMFMLMKYYEQHGVDEFIPVSPMDLYKHLGIGVRLIDEVHQEFHCNFRQDIYTHIPLTASLSATLEPDSPFIRDMYELVWPPGTWAPEMEYNKFIAVKSIWYRLNDPGKLRWLNFMRQYSHTEYEKSILKHPQILQNYLDMIADLVVQLFMCKREPGQKMMIFVATVQMATIVQEMLANIYPNLIVNRYVSEDEYEDLVGADISVTTLQSAGTAVDIPNLRVTLMTTALSTKQGNIQVLGRTRPLIGWPDVTPEFCFLSAKDVDKHVTYAKEKREKLSGKVKSFQDLQSDYRV